MRLITLLLLLPIAVFSQDLTLTISSQEVPSCGGESDGLMILMATGGESPYLYSIVGGMEQESNIFQGLSAGEYEFSVTDSNGTVATVSGTLENGPNLSININDAEPTCIDAVDGQLMVTEVSGLSGVTYEISGPASESNMTGIFTDLPIGIYVVKASTSSECLVVISTELSSDIECEEDLTLTISSQETASCDGVSNGVVNLLANGGVSPYLYGIVGGNEQESSTFQELEAGDYLFFVTDANGSTVEISGTVENEINLSINITEIDPTCTNASDGRLLIAEVTGVSNLTYEISGTTSASNTTGIFTDLPIGNYEVSVSTSLQCSLVLSATLSSDEDCPDPNICPLLANRIGMQINKVGEEEYTLRMQYQDEIDFIEAISYTALYDIIHFHLYQRQMNISLKPDFEFKNYCGDVESMRNGTNNNSSNDDAMTSNTQNEIDFIRNFVLQIRNGESVKI